MIVYDGQKKDFLNSVENDTIAIEIEKNILEKMGRTTAKSEFNSWTNSLARMYVVLNDSDIPNDAGIAIEYNIPQTSKRIDFMISGYNDDNQPGVVVIELKQWDRVGLVKDQDALVETFTGGANRKVAHPSYQVWSYVQMIKDYNTKVQDIPIRLEPCAFLHNYLRKNNDPIDNETYEPFYSEAPVFTKGDVHKLREFIKKVVRKGDQKNIIFEIDHGKIRPSKSLQDSIASMLQGNREFIMIDEQKVAYEEILRVSQQCQKDYKKRTVIVEGGPGTGKSVIAVNLLAELTQRGQFVQYVSKNGAPRLVYQKKLKGVLKKTSVDNLFKGSGTYVETGKNAAGTLIVDDYAIIGLSQRAA